MGVAIPPVVAWIFAGDRTSPLTRDGHGCSEVERPKALSTDAYKWSQKSVQDAPTANDHDCNGRKANRAFIWQG
ncbi:MAG: hypothetical protein ACLTZI_05095 [[Eubacterium] siraeum]